MQPAYASHNVEIYAGDCFEVLAELGALDGMIAAVVTDPPYSSGARLEAHKSKSGAMTRGARFPSPIENDQMTTAGFLWTFRALLRRLRPALVKGGSVLSFIDWRQWPNLLGAFESVDYRVNGMVVWDKDAMGLGSGFRLQHELILHASKGKPEIYDRSVPNVLTCKRDRKTDHPSPKPVELMERLIKVVSKPGDLILDPFLGSGSTAIAARNLGRYCLGIEAVGAHVETAIGRLEA